MNILSCRRIISEMSRCVRRCMVRSCRESNLKKNAKIDEIDNRLAEKENDSHHQQNSNKPNTYR